MAAGNITFIGTKNSSPAADGRRDGGPRHPGRGRESGWGRYRRGPASGAACHGHSLRYSRAMPLSYTP